MKYVMVLAERHPAPAHWGSVFDDKIGIPFDRPYAEIVRILEKQAERRIPNNATELVVYMTGLKAYRDALYRIAMKRGIRLECRRIKTKELDGAPITKGYAKDPANYYLSGFYNPKSEE